MHMCPMRYPSIIWAETPGISRIEADKHCQCANKSAETQPWAWMLDVLEFFVCIEWNELAMREMQGCFGCNGIGQAAVGMHANSWVTASNRSRQ